MTPSMKAIWQAFEAWLAANWPEALEDLDLAPDVNRIVLAAGSTPDEAIFGFGQQLA